MSGFWNQFFLGAICGINLLFFYKMVRMSNDVRKLTERFCGDETEALTSGKDARRALLSDLRAIANKARGMDVEEYKRIYDVSPNDEIADLILKYKKVYSRLGEDMPRDVANVKTVFDLWEMFD